MNNTTITPYYKTPTDITNKTQNPAKRHHNIQLQPNSKEPPILTIEKTPISIPNTLIHPNPNHQLTLSQTRQENLQAVAASSSSTPSFSTLVFLEAGSPLALALELESAFLGPRLRLGVEVGLVGSSLAVRVVRLKLSLIRRIRWDTALTVTSICC